MSRLRVAYAGHDFFFSCLATLASRDDTEVVACLTEGPEGQPANCVLELATQLGARIHTGRLSDEFIAALQELELDLLVCAAYMYRLPIRRLSVPIAVNVHPTLLPYGRGPNPLPYLASSHPELSGITIHEMTEELDNGPILIRRGVKVSPDEGLDEIYLKLCTTAAQTLNSLLDDLPGHLGRKEDQDGGSYWPAMAGDILDARSQGVEDAIRLHKYFGMFGFLVRLEQGESFRASLLTATQCNHEFKVGSRVARLRVGTLVALRDGVIRLDERGALPPVKRTPGG
jgi:methionyl-tRNA formyltransferase